MKLELKHKYVIKLWTNKAEERHDAGGEKTNSRWIIQIAQLNGIKTKQKAAKDKGKDDGDGDGDGDGKSS